MDQFKGVQKRSSAAKHGFGQKQQQESEKGNSPANNQLRINYGVITEVNHETSKVKVRMFNNFEGDKDIIVGASKPGDPGIFIPIIQPLHVIHHLYGALRKGLCVKIYWRGTNLPGSESIAEVVSDETHDIFKTGDKEQEVNQRDIGPWKIFSGGLIG